MKLQFIEIDKLYVDRANMRFAKRPPDVSDILPSVRKRGILQTLIVRPGEEDRFGILAGSRRFRAGEVLFLKDDPAHEMYLIESGRFRIAEHGLDVRPGQIVGELGMLSPGNRRTGSLACVEAGSARCLSYSEVKQLYYQNPEFGFYFLKLTSERLFQSAAETAGTARPAAPVGSDVL